MAKIILITHQKGGVGKSTLTFNLACNLKESAKVCILDMDSQGSVSSPRSFVISTPSLKRTTECCLRYYFSVQGICSSFILSNIFLLCSVSGSAISSC